MGSRVQSSMSYWVQRLRLTSVVTAASLLGACLAPAPGLSPSPDVNGASPATSDLSAGWEVLAPGLERRLWRPSGSAFNSFVAVRIDPARYSFRAHYTPGGARTAAEWRDALPGAAVFVNANFFTPEDTILGLLVADGLAYGGSYAGMGGMLQVAGGQVRVRSLIREPYQGEPLEQAVQAFPMLVLDGQAVFEFSGGDRASRRTVVGQDEQGRIVLLVSSSLFGLTLAEMSTALASAGFGLVNALNLDGGGSSMLGLNVAGSALIPSFDAVPAVLAVYPRGG